MQLKRHKYIDRQDRADVIKRREYTHVRFRIYIYRYAIRSTPTRVEGNLELHNDYSLYVSVEAQRPR